jgi:hypothetical protein
MNIPASVDGHVPVRAHHETDINAPLDTVWRLHTTEESFAGEPVEADITGMQSTLDSSLISWLAHLKAAAESGG